MRWQEVASLPGIGKREADWVGLERNRRTLTIRLTTVRGRDHIVAEVTVGSLAPRDLQSPFGGLVKVKTRWVLRHTLALDGLSGEDLEIVLDAMSHEATRLAASETARATMFLHFAA